MSGNAGSFEQRRRARQRIVQALYQWQMTGGTSIEISKQFLEEQSWKNVDAEYFEALLTQAIAEDAKVVERLQEFLDRPVKQVDYLERAVLQLAATELIYRPEIPYKVIIDEAIDLAHRFCAEQGHSYVNAVLDKAARSWRASEAGANA